MTAKRVANNLDLNSKKILNLATPTAAGDGSNKSYVDAALANAVSRANHTGTQLANTISNFDTAVRANRLDQLATPVNPVVFGSQRLTSVGDPTSAQDAATKAYVDTAVSGIASGLQFKGLVAVAVNSNVNIVNPGTATFDGVTVATGEIVLLYGQTTGSQNGPYTFNGAGVGMTRAANWDTQAEAQIGSFWVVSRGTKADNFAIGTNDTFTLGTDTLALQFVGVAPSATLPVETDLGDGAATQFTVTHNLGTKAVRVTTFRNASPYDEIDVYVARPTINTVSIEPDDVWTAAQFHVVVSRA